MDTLNLIKGTIGVGAVEAVEKTVPMVQDGFIDVIGPDGEPIITVVKLLVQVVIGIATIVSMFKKKKK